MKININKAGENHEIEGFIAYQLPDLIGAVALPLIMLGAMFTLDWRMALACSFSIIAAYLLQSIVFYGEEGMAAMNSFSSCPRGIKPKSEKEAPIFREEKHSVLSLRVISEEVLRSLCGTIGLILTIPFSSFMASIRA